MNEIEIMAKLRWNRQADEFNCWDSLSDEEKEELTEAEWRHNKRRAEQLAIAHWSYVNKVLEHAGKPFDEGVKQAYRHGFVYGYTKSEPWNIKSELRTVEEVFHFNSACEHGKKHRHQDDRREV